MIARSALLFVALAACGDDVVPAADFGAQLFADPALSPANGNAYACATCHARTAADPTRFDSGYTLADSAFRPAWWGGHEIEYLDAASFCFTAFMGSKTPLDPTSIEARSLYEYLASISPQSSPVQPMTVQKYVLDVDRGDPQRGADIYTAACARCHGDYQTGAKRLTMTAPIMPDVFQNYSSTFPGLSVPLLVIEKIRHGNRFGIGGTMPLYSKEAMSDDDLGALLAFFAL